MRWSLAVLVLCVGCGGDKDDGDPDTPIAPVAPTAGNVMYQGGQWQFRTRLGDTCTGRVAASMGGSGFCFLGADDDVKCAGTIGDVVVGVEFASIGQTSASQIMVMWLDNGMCVART